MSSGGNSQTCQSRGTGQTGSVEKRKFSWSEIWGMESNRLSFIIRATYDALISPINLQLWFGKTHPVVGRMGTGCPLDAPWRGYRMHILVGCRTSLTQGRYTWRHNQVLRCLAKKVECKRKSINAQPLRTKRSVSFHQHLSGKETCRGRALQPGPGPAEGCQGLADASGLGSEANFSHRDHNNNFATRPRPLV